MTDEQLQAKYLQKTNAYDIFIITATGGNRKRLDK